MKVDFQDRSNGDRPKPSLTNRRRQKAKKKTLFFTLSFTVLLFTVFVHGVPALSGERIAKTQSNAAQSSVLEIGVRGEDFVALSESNLKIGSRESGVGSREENFSFLIGARQRMMSDLSVLVQQGRDYYNAGQFAQAVTVWEQAASSFATQGDGLNQALVLSNLSLAYQHLGQWTQAKAAIRNAIASLHAKSLDLLQAGTGTSEARSRILAQVLNTQGSLQLALGQAEQALATWQQAAGAYRQANDEAGMLKSQINQAQALKSLGFYRRALATLTQVNQALQQQPDSLVKSAALRSLGSAFLVTGDLEQSQQVLKQSLNLAQRLQSAEDIAATLYDLGNTARVGQDAKAALEYYQQAAALAVSAVTKIQAQLNQLSLLIETQQKSAAQKLWPKIQSQLDNLPPSRATVYAQIDLAMSLMKLSKLSHQPTTESP